MPTTELTDITQTNAGDHSWPSDPLLSDVKLPFEGVCYPLGFPLEIKTNDPEMLSAAQKYWASFQRVFSVPPLRLRIGITEGRSKRCPPAPVYRGQGNLVTLVADAENFAACDMRRGFGFGWLTTAALRDREYVMDCFVSTMVIAFMLDPLYLTGIHAACVGRNGRGILLCGPSSAGKSSLTYACTKRGWTFVSDDACRLVRGREDRVVLGEPHRMRFRESAVELFPELEGRRSVLRLNGKRSIEVRTADLKGIETAYQSPVHAIVYLNRHGKGPARLRPFSKEEAFRRLSASVCVAEPEIREAQRVALRHLLGVGVWELSYRDLDSAVSELETLVAGTDAC